MRAEIGMISTPWAVLRRLRKVSCPGSSQKFSNVFSASVTCCSASSAVVGGAFFGSSAQAGTDSSPASAAHAVNNDMRAANGVMLVSLGIVGIKFHDSAARASGQGTGQAHDTERRAERKLNREFSFPLRGGR